MSLPDSLHWSPVASITAAGLDECLCISVSDPSRCYVTAAGMVTHNSNTRSIIDRLPPNPRKLLEHLLAGQSLPEAAVHVGLPVDRAPAIAQNIGKVLARDWQSQGLSEEDALQQLAQYAQEHPVLSAGQRRLGNAASRASFNHADRWLTAKLGQAARNMRLPEALEKLSGMARSVPFFERALDLFVSQGMPLSRIPAEALSLMRDMQIKSAFGKQLSLDVHRSLTGKAKFTNLVYPPGFADNPAAKKQLYLAMTGEINLAQLPQDMQDLAATLRQMLVSAGEEAVRAGRMSPDTLLNLQDTYLPHYYEDDLKRGAVWRKAARLLGLHDVLAQRTTAWHIVDTTRKDPKDPKEDALITWDQKGAQWRFRDAAHRDAFYEDFIRTRALQMLQGGGSQVTDLIAAVPTNERTAMRADISRLTRSDMDRPEKLSPALRGVVNQAKAQMRRRFERRAPLTVDEQEKAGLIFDPIYSVVRYLGQMHQDNAVATFFNSVAADPQWTTDTETAGYKLIPDTRAFGELAGKYVLEPIADQVLQIAGDESPLMEFYDDLMRAWSSGKTVWNPGTHVRNFLGNIPFSQLAGSSIHNPANWAFYAEAGRILRDGGDALRDLYQQGVLGADYGSQELRSALRELLPDASLMGDEPPARFMQRVSRALFGRLPGTLQRAGARTSAFVNGAYQLTDDWFKAAAYLKARDMGLSTEDAAAHVRKWFPYYDNIGSSSGIKFARRLFPFLSFFRESARIFGLAVKERPLALAGSLIMPYVLTQMAMAMLGLDDKDKEEVLKDMRGKLIFKGLTGEWPGFAFLLPWRSEGKLAQFDLSNVMPFAGFLGRPLETGANETFVQYWARKLVTSSPAGNLLAGIGMNQDPFSGRNITEDDMTPAEKAYAQARYAWMLLTPPLLGTSGAQLAQMGDRATNKTLEKRNTVQTLMRALVGLDVRNASPDLYRLAEDYRKAHGLTTNEAWSGGTTAQQRARQALFAELAQDEPNVQNVAKILRYLKTSGKPVATQQDINRLLFYRNPLMLLPGSHQASFRASLTGESRQVLDAALAEFAAIQSRAPRVISQAQLIANQP